MGGLLGLLDLGASAMLAQNAGASIAARNTANLTTEGYSRQSLHLRSELGAPTYSGVRAGTIIRSADDLLSARIRQQTGSFARADDLAAAMGPLETALAPATGGLHERMAAFFGSLSDLASAPLDPSLRGQAVQRAGELATTFNRASRDITSARTEANNRIATLADRASELASTMARLNLEIAKDGDPVLADQRDLVAKELSELVGGRANLERDGGMRFVLDGGQVLVDGERSAALQVEPDPANGNLYRVRTVQGPHAFDVTAHLTGGRIGAQLHLRDTVAGRAAASLDQLAFDFATQVNIVHNANAGTDGVAGRPLFVTSAGPGGAAEAIAVSAGVLADPRTLATAAPGAGAGSTGGITALLALESAPLAGGGARTFRDEAIEMIGAVGSAGAGAAADLELESARSDFLAGLRDALSGVSIDEELARLSAFQHAAEASHRFIATVNEMLGDLIARI